jgi:hypothetical protein
VLLPQVRFLSSNVHGWQTLCPPPDTSDPDNVRINDFLEACLAAGQALQVGGCAGSHCEQSGVQAQAV